MISGVTYSATVPSSVREVYLYKWENEARDGRKLKEGVGLVYNSSMQ